MSTARQGTVLAGRYRLERRIQTDPDGALWRAQDSALERPVCIRVLRPGHPFAADVADAARRAALVDDPRLIRVLNVGTDGDTAFVVTEHVHGESLAAAIDRGPLPAPMIRRIVGEVAEGLADAAGRGLHHLRLTPRSVMITPDGSIKLLGTATEAAAAGLESDHASTANRVDAVGLVALLYYGLTGRWPLGDAGFPPAPRGEAGPVAPADLTRDVPGDLDTLSAVTLGPHNDGPRSPAEVARQLAPWPSAAEAKRAPAPQAIRDQRPAAPEIPPEALRPATLANGPKPMVKPSPSSLFAPITPVSPDAIRTARQAAAARALGQPVPHDPAPRARTTQPAAAAPAEPAANPSAASAAPAPTASAPPLTEDMSEPATRKPPGARPSVKRAGGKPAARPASSAAPAPAAADPVPPAEQTAVLNRGASTPGNGTARPGGTNRRAAIRNHPDTGPVLIPWSGAWTPASQAYDAPEHTGPFPIIIPPEQPPPRQSRMVLLGVGVALVIGLILAVFSLPHFGGDDTPSSAVAPLTSTSTPNSAQTRAAQPQATTAPPTPAATTPAAVAPVIAKIRAIDPQGDDEENGDQAPKAVDRYGNTSWSSDIYKTSAFGGLKKGVGLAIRLAEPSAVTKVEVDLDGSGGALELRGGSSFSYDDSTLLGSSAVTGNTVTLTSSSTKKFQYVIVWITKLPDTSDGYRAEISEVRVT